MVRTQQRGRDRRDQLLDCAEALFFEKGYEAATIHDLMRTAEVSKGAVYHHFKSKDEVLHAISLRLAQASAESVTNIVENRSIGAVDKLNAVFEALRNRKAAAWPRLQGSFESLFAPGNVVLFHQISQTLARTMAPLFARVLQDGIDQGCFKITDAQTVAEMLLHLEGAIYSAFSEATAAPGGTAGPAGAAIISHRLAQIGIAMDRLLGLPDHTIILTRPVGGATLPQL